MSGSIAAINVYNIGANGTPPSSVDNDGATGGAGQSVSDTGSVFDDQNFYTTTAPIEVEPYAEGGTGTTGVVGASGQTDEQGATGGAGGGGGDATITMADDSYGSTATPQTASLVYVSPGAIGGAGGNGATGGDGGGGPQYQVGGGGGDGGQGAQGGAASADITGFSSDGTHGTVFDFGAVAGSGGAGGSGGDGGSGDTQGASGHAADGGTGGGGGGGGSAEATLSGADSSDSQTISVIETVAAGNGGDGGNGGLPGSSENYGGFTIGPNGSGGRGGGGGNATATVTDNVLTGYAVSFDLSAQAGGGGAGGSPSNQPNGEVGTFGDPGQGGTGLIVMTNNTVTLGPLPQYIPPSQSKLTIELAVTTTIIRPPSVGNTPVTENLNGAPGGNLEFSGNQFIGNGASTLDLELSGNGSVTVDTAANTISIDGSPANGLTGFTTFDLDNNDIFVVGAGSYTVTYADPDTIVYTPNSGNVTLTNVSDSNLELDFEGFGSALTPTVFASDTKIVNGNTVISIAGAGTLTLDGYTSTIPSGDVTFTAACYLAGTLIHTDRGDVAVEALAAGDRVITQEGVARPIIWVGRRRFDARCHPSPETMLPVRIAAGALGEGVPSRALWVSPDHALLLDGVLVQAKALVNDASIVQDASRAVGVYYHIELESHDVILAEGAAAESYLDTGNRASFDNGGAVVALHPAFAAHRWDDTCAPMVLEGPALAAIRARLLERAAAMGFATTRDPDAHLVIDNRRLDAAGCKEGWLRFMIPKGAGAVRLCSRTAVPAHALAGTADTRRLGVFVTGLRVSEPAGRRAIALDSPALSAGWHSPEAGGRWTDGDAALDLRGPCLLEMALGDGLPYRVIRAVPLKGRRAG